MKDRQGNEIRVGNVVASAITINQKRFSESFTVMVCKKKSNGRLILDGVWGWGYLSEMKPRELQIINESTDLRSLCSEWIREFGRDDYDSVYMTSQDAHEFYESVCGIIKMDVYASTGDNDLRKDKVLNTLMAIVEKDLVESGPEKIIELTKSIEIINKLKQSLENSLKILRS